MKFEDGVVWVEMQGSCKGCPYAMRTLKDGVEKILKTYIPEVKEGPENANGYISGGRNRKRYNSTTTDNNSTKRVNYSQMVQC